MMTRFSKYIKNGMLALSWAAVFSCKPGDFGTTNVNPNASETPVTAALLTNVINQSARGFTITATEPGLYAQYIANSQYPEASLYSTTSADFGFYYSGPLNDLQNIINYNTNTATKATVAAYGSNNNQIAVARILKAYFFQVVTDRWGDVPYSEALKGFPTPKYDTQQSIYTDLFKELKAASAQFDSGSTVQGDILFGGDASKWKKFANSLRMVMALRLSKVDAATGKAEFASALADAAGSISTNTDNAAFAYLNNTDFRSPWAAAYDGRDDFGVSDVFVGALQTSSDPRLPALVAKIASGKYLGIPYGLKRDLLITWTSQNPQYSHPGAPIVQADSKGYILSAAQILLSRAEAAQLGWTSENVNTLYASAIRASFEQWGVYDATTYAAYMASANVSLAGGNVLQKIGTQKWIALYPNGNEAWAEWRRTGYPALTPTPYAVNVSKQIPRRYAYPTSEQTLNKTNYDAAITRLSGGDTHDARVWWDVK